jgi:hypothetical protein
MIEQALESIKEDEFPTLPEEREKFCMEQLSTGEALLSRGKKKKNWEGFRIYFARCML